MSSRNRLFTFCFGLVLAGVGGLSATLAGELHWPQFRGPLGNGVAEVHSAPESWGVDRNIAWKRDLPGRGWSSPVSADGLIWLTRPRLKRCRR
ncbi:MAG: hypothetical protein R3C01_11620 [Planctomycetaceae bacterium]